MRANSETNARGIARREQILDVATDLFATRGYRGTGMLEIAKRVGISQPAVHYHFGTKEDLLRAVIERRDKLHDDLMSEFQGLGLDGFMDEYVTDASTFMEPEILTRLVTVLRAENLSPGGPLHEMFDQRAKQTRAFLAAEIRAKQGLGLYRVDVDPETKAAEMFSFIIGLEMQWLLNKDEVNLTEVFTGYIRTLVDDLARPKLHRE